MGWNVIRKASKNEVAAIDRAAIRFCARHNLNGPYAFAGAGAFTIECAIACESNGASLKKLWRGVVRYHLGPHAEGIALGCVGYRS